MLNNKLTTLILLTLCLLAGILINFFLNKPYESPNMAETQQVNEISLTPTVDSEVQTLTNIDELDEIIERPLFSNTRRQQQEETEEVFDQQVAPQKPLKMPDLTLVGIVLSDDGKVALIKSKKNPKLQRVKLNEFISGWKLVELNPRSAKMESGSQSFTLEMQRKKGASRKQTKTSTKQNSQKQTVP